MQDSNGKQILLNEDGSVVGERFHFSKTRNNYTGSYPSPLYGKETFAQYRLRVINNFQPNGFDIGDLTFADYELYCKGSGTFEDVNCEDLI